MNGEFEDKLFSMAEAEKLSIPSAFTEKMEAVLSDLGDHHQVRKVKLRKILILAAAFTVLFSITVTASVGLLRQRMAALNQEKIEEFFAQIYQRRIPHENYNRYLTASEEERKQQLQKEYEEGRFPQSELTMIEEAADYRSRGVAYLADTGTFFFPDNELSDEELLQMIDFRYKMNYSLEQMNEKIAAGEIELSEVLESGGESEPEVTDSGILESEAVWEPGQDLTIEYQNDLAIYGMGAGKRDIYLGGMNTVHKMAIGSDHSQVFFDGFEKETRVDSLFVDADENVYIGGLEIIENIDVGTGQNSEEYASLERSGVIWKVAPDGRLLQTIRLDEYTSKSNGWINRIAVDAQGYIYVRGLGGHERDGEILILDAEGNFVSRIYCCNEQNPSAPARQDVEGNILSQILPEAYHFHQAGGLGLGKDGAVYTMIRRASDRAVGIARVNPEEGTLGDIYLGIVPAETIMLHVIAPGSDSDFVFWGYDGTFNYNLGEKNAVNVMPAYEAPCDYEGVKYCALRDGRIVLASCSEYKTFIYYRTSLRI